MKLIQKHIEIKHIALTTLSDTFLKIAKSESIERSDLKSAVITFEFKSDTWPYFCEISVESICGKTLSVRVDSMGNKATKLNMLL